MSILRIFQAAILAVAVFFHIIAYDAILNEKGALQRSLASEEALELSFHRDEGRGNDEPRGDPQDLAAMSPLEEHLANSNINGAGKEMVRYYSHDDQPLRHLRFADLVHPEAPREKTPITTTAHVESTVITQAPWFNHRKVCKETCCVQPVAISMKQDETRIINSIDGPDVADLLLHGHSLQPHHKFAASELTKDVLPCLKPGVIIHADSQSGPITRFFDEFRPNITVPYVFLTTKADGDTPNNHYRHRMDTDPLLRAWYGINPNYKFGANHPKFQMMPLGLSGGLPQSPYLNILLQARNYTNPFGGDKSRWTNQTLWKSVNNDTTTLLFVKFGMKKSHRNAPFQMACNNRTMPPLDNVTCTNTGIYTPQETYAASSEYLFGLSPPGNGRDCYRTYELLMNGIIPIVRAQPEYDELFRDLPVLQLPHWKYTQAELVQVMHDYIHSPGFLNNTFNAGWERLFLKYWRHKVLRDAGRDREIVADPEGNQYYLTWQYSPYKPPYVEHAPPAQVAIRKKKEEEQRRLQQM